MLKLVRIFLDWLFDPVHNECAMCGTRIPPDMTICSRCHSEAGMVSMMSLANDDLFDDWFDND